MSAIGLSRFPPLARLDASGLSLWKVYLVTLLAGVALAVVLMPFSNLVNPESPLAPGFTPELMVTKLIINGLLCGFGVFACIAMARTAEADLLVLAEVDPAVEATFKSLRPGVRTSALTTLACVFLLAAFSPVVVVVNSGATMGESIHYHLTAGFGPLLIVGLMPLLLGSAISIGCVVAVAQIRTLIQVAKVIRVDLLNLEHYTAIASPFMRYVLIILFVFSGLPPFLLMDDPDLTAGVYSVIPVFMVLFVPFLTGYFMPLLILRNRIRDSKLAALAALRSPGQSDDVLPALALSGYTEVSPPDRLTQMMFIESRWEWPVASHIQRLLFFGMLPPLTWVMAAVVENLMF